MFRKAALSDLDAIVSIYDAIHTREESGLTTTGWLRSVYPTRSTAEQAIHIGDMFVLEEHGTILAAARINHIQGEEYKLASWTCDAPAENVMVLHTLVVHPERAGDGIGTRFVAFYEELAVKNNSPFLRLDTNARNRAARSLYRKLGYQEVGIVPCVFNGIDGVQLVCLEKTL